MSNLFAQGGVPLPNQTIPVPTPRPYPSNPMPVAQPPMQPQQAPQGNFLTRGVQNPQLRNLMVAAGTTMANGGRGFGQTLMGLQQQGQQTAQANMTAQWLEAKGADPQLVQMAAQGMGAQALQLWKESQPAEVKPPSPYTSQGKMKADLDAGFITQDQYNASLAGGVGEGNEYGTTLYYGRDKNGKVIVFQSSKAGGLRQADVPEGVEFLGPMEKAQETSLGSNIGKNQAEARNQLPIASEKAREVFRLTDAILNDPALPGAVGPIDGRMPTFFGGSTQFEARVEQLKDIAFLSARQELKGGGAITDYEGQRAEVALNRAKLAMNENDFKEAMLEFKAAMMRGYQLLQEQAGLSGQGTQQNSFDENQTGKPSGTTSSGVKWSIE